MNTLIQSEALFHALVDSVNEYAIFMLDPTGVVMTWNSGAERIKGYRADEIVGQHFSRFYEDADVLAGKCERALEEACVTPRFADEGWRVRKDGRRFWASVVISAVRDPKTQMLLGFAKITRDLTAKTKADTQFAALLETAPDGMVICNRDGQIILVNAQTEALFGHPRRDLLGRPLEILIPERFRTKHEGHQRAFFADPKMREMGAGVDLYGLRKDGSEFPVEISIGPVDTAEGLILSCAIRDITRRKLTESALQVANRELKAFSYSVAHDLRAPLRGLEGFARLLSTTYADKLDAEGQDWLNEIATNATKMRGLIDAMLALSRVSRAQLRTESVDLSAIATATLNGLAGAHPERAVKTIVARDLRADLDPDLARSLVENLLGNAWKFTSHTANACIEVGTAATQGASHFFVRDNGAGFDMDFAGKLFAPFHRLHTNDRFPGTGIGLATVQRIVLRHGGTIWAEGHVDRGATFWFTLGAPS